jgi:endonuclease/exonuclease/phosphatase (EEP) superfamily protein YafD
VKLFKRKSDPQAPSATPATPAKPKRHREWALAVLGLFGGFFALIAARLGTIWPAFDVFSQFTAQIIFWCAGFAAAISIFRRMKFTFGLVFTLMMSMAYGFWPHLVSDVHAPLAASPQKGQRALKVAHFNTYILNDDLKAVAATVLELDADVMSLVELYDDSPALLNLVRTKYPYQAGCENRSSCEIAIISKYPLVDVEARHIWAGPALVKATLRLPTGAVTVVAAHMIRFPHSRAQFNQANALVKYLERLPNPLVLMGDFNATPFSRVTKIISDGRDLQLQTYLPSWPAQFELPQLAIDHIFTSTDIAPLGRQSIGNRAGSDHMPIIMTLAAPAK